LSSAARVQAARTVRADVPAENLAGRDATRPLLERVPCPSRPSHYTASSGPPSAHWPGSSSTGAFQQRPPRPLLERPVLLQLQRPSGSERFPSTPEDVPPDPPTSIQPASPG